MINGCEFVAMNYLSIARKIILKIYRYLIFQNSINLRRKITLKVFDIVSIDLKK